MQLEEGKYYKDRSGLIWGPLKRETNPALGVYWWTAPGATRRDQERAYLDNGHWLDVETEHPKDLIEELPLDGSTPRIKLKITDIEDHGPSTVVGVNFVDFSRPESDMTAAALAIRPGYDTLADVLQLALNQAQSGKGSSRHTDKPLPWIEQPILEIARMVGTGGHAFQIMKKTQEAHRMAQRGQYDAAVAELLGAINYAAAAVLLIREIETETGQFDTGDQQAAE